MATIEELLKLDLGKITSEPLKDALNNLIADYRKEEDKTFFQTAAAANIDKLMAMVKKHAPQALSAAGKGKESAVKTKAKPKKTTANGKGSDNYTMVRELASSVLERLTDIGIDLDDEDENIVANTRSEIEEALAETNKMRSWSLTKKAIENLVKDSSGISNAQNRKRVLSVVNDLAQFFGASASGAKTGKKPTGKSTEDTKAITEELKALEPELEACRAAIREYNKRKKEAEGPKPKKTRFTKLKEKLLALVGLIPESLQDDINVQRETEKILLDTHQKLVTTWKMDRVKAKPGADAIKEKFDQMEERLSEEIDHYDISSIKGGGTAVIEYFKDGSKRTTRLSKATIDWVNAEHGGSFSKVSARKLLQKEESHAK